jgi:hypothetical protein
VAGDALPLAVVENPGIGEASEVVVGLAVVGAFGVIDAGDDAGVVIEVYFQILDVDQRGLELGIFNVGQKLAALADFAVPFGVREGVGDHAFESALVAMDLRLVPHTLEHDQFGGLRIVFVVSRLREGSERQENQADGYELGGLHHASGVGAVIRAHAGKTITGGENCHYSKVVVEDYECHRAGSNLLGAQRLNPE